MFPECFREEAFQPNRRSAGIFRESDLGIGDMNRKRATMMKKIYTLCIFFLCITGTVFAQTTPKDSLQQALETLPSGPQRLEVLTNLMDMSGQAEVLTYGKQLYQEAREANDAYHKEAALTEILRQYVNTDQRDSAQYYLGEVDRELQGEAKESLRTFMQMILDTRIVFYTDGEEKKQILQDKLLQLETDKKLSPYKRMAAYYVLGMVVANDVKADLPEKTLKGINFYFQHVIDIARTLPIRYAYQYQPNSFWLLCNYSPTMDERASYARQYLNLLTRYMETKEMKKRPFYNNKRHLLNAYGLLSSLSPVIGKDMAASYYQRFLSLNKQYPEAANVTPEFEYLYTSLNYYENRKEYRKAVEYADSLIPVLKKANLADNIIMCVEKKIEMYDSLQMYREAYDTYKEYTILLDTLHAKRVQKQLDELEIQQNVNNLVIEKKSLELKLHESKAQTYLFLALFILSFSSVVYIILRFGKIKSLYQKIKDSNDQLLIANEKALESEKMKNAFIRNMYHEVRTPLNAINGFSEIIANDPDLPQEDKQQFSGIIHENCTLLTSMLDNVLKISQLDSSNEELPLAPVPLYDLCLEEMEKVKKFQKKDGIVYRVEGMPENAIVQTNRTYLALALARLLNNASKFTQSGSITLSYTLDTDKKRLTLRVTDTGCGIPADKHQWIFERFSKTDEFTPGTGLGLHLCQLIAHRLKGDIKVDPAYTEGASFVLTLPL